MGMGGWCRESWPEARGSKEQVSPEQAPRRSCRGWGVGAGRGKTESGWGDVMCGLAQFRVARNGVEMPLSVFLFLLPKGFSYTKHHEMSSGFGRKRAHRQN